MGLASTRIELFDTTLRDGTQGEHVSLTAHDKLRIARRLDAFGVRIIEGGWPGSNPKDHAFFEAAKDAAFSNAALCAFGATRRSGLAPEEDPSLAAMLAAETPVVSVFGKSWTLHAEVALGVTLEENLELIRSTVAYLKAHGRRVIYDAEHFFDGYKADAAYALATLAAAAEAGADVLVLCDTNGGTLPLDVYETVRTVVDRFEQPVGIHAHNDAGCAVANSVMAVQAGARHVQGTVGGIGERCGNADLCAVTATLQLKLGYDCVSPEQLAGLAGLAAFVEEVANLTPGDRAPYVGRSAFAHKGGVHVSAVLKTPATYEHIDPAGVGNRRRVLVSDLAGGSNVRYLAAERGLDLDDRDEARRVALRVKELEHQGYAFEGAEASFDLLVGDMRGDAGTFFTLERARVRTEMGEGGTCAEATVVLCVGEGRELAVAEGVGPVDALSKALRRALDAFYPALSDVRLTDYKVRVLTGAEGTTAGTAASVRVLATHSDGAERWNTVGVSEDILTASWQALVDGVRYYLVRSGARPPLTAAHGGLPRTPQTLVAS